MPFQIFCVPTLLTSHLPKLLPGCPRAPEFYPRNYGNQYPDDGHVVKQAQTTKQTAMAYITVAYVVFLTSTLANIFLSRHNMVNVFHDMMTSSNGNIFRVTGPSWVKFIGHRWISRTKASDAEFWCFLWSAPEKNGWVHSRGAGDLIRHRAQYDVTVMISFMTECYIWGEACIVLQMVSIFGVTQSKWFY